MFSFGLQFELVTNTVLSSSLPHSHLPAQAATQPSHTNTSTPVATVQGTEQPAKNKGEVSRNVSLLQATGSGKGKEGSKYVAVHDFEGIKEGDLCFSVGDIIEVGLFAFGKFDFRFPLPFQVVNSERDWWTGVLSGVKGIFPSNYVQPVSDPFPTASAGTSDVTVLTEPLPVRVIVGESVLSGNGVKMLLGELGCFGDLSCQICMGEGLFVRLACISHVTMKGMEMPTIVFMVTVPWNPFLPDRVPSPGKRSPVSLTRGVTHGEEASSVRMVVGKETNSEQG